MADATPVYDEKSFWSKTKTFLELYWKSIVIVAWPLITLPFLIEYWRYSEVRCAYVVCMMALYWVSNVLPMSVTALLPVALYPLLDILSTEDTCKCYMNDTVIMFIGGLVLALAVEHSNLHMRIALRVMTIVGCSHGKLMAGLLFVVTFLSSWVSNTAATVMILPIIFAVLGELEKEGIGKVFNEVEGPDNEKYEEATKVTRGYLMAAAYAASFGGTSTFVGTGTNLTFRGLFREKFPNHKGLSFFQWSLLAAPQAYINAFLTWLYIQVFYFGMFRPNSEAAKTSKIGAEGEAIAKRVMAEKYKNLGSMSFHERCVSILFAATVLLWLTRDPGFISGWYSFFPRPETPIENEKSPGNKEDFILDSTPVIFITVLMFIIPKEPQFLHACSKDANKRPTEQSEGLVTWNLIQTKVPWGMMFLLGGGFAISKGGTASGLAKAVAKSFNSLKMFPPFTIMCLLCTFIGCVTEFTSNIGIANLILPVIMEMSISMQIDPLYLLLPATIMCSYAFRLPVGTPPNALITQYGKMQAKHLVVGGCIPAIYGLLAVVITCSTWGLYVYEIDLDAGLPSWVSQQNDSQSDNNFLTDFYQDDENVIF